MFLSYFLKTLFPGDCLICKCTLSSPGDRSPIQVYPGWPAATLDFFTREHSLRINRLLEVDASVLCPSCWLSLTPARKPYHVAKDGDSVSVAPFQPDERLLELVRFLKFRGGRTASVPLGWWMAEALRELDRYMPSGVGADMLLVPVPLHMDRRRSRGYNQAELLAREVGRILDMEVAGDVLVRTRNTKAQTSLESAARKENVRGAFVAGPGKVLAGRRVVLVDDLQTTGATLGSCVEALRGLVGSPLILLTAGRPEVSGGPDGDSPLPGC